MIVSSPDVFRDRLKGSGVMLIVIAFAAMLTVTGALLENASLTINCATYVPARSATNVGDTVVAPASTAALPAGFVISDQE